MKAYLSKFYLEIISILLFSLIFPYYLNISFMQNDDWAYYQNIQNFLSGNFYLIPKTAPTFYSIGIIGSFWSLAFGIKSLPLLTLLISISNFYIFAKIIEIKFRFSKFSNIFLSFLLLTNFLHSYSSIGFMTENYLIFFLLLSILFFEKFEISHNLKELHVSNVFSILAFFVKQSGLIFICATAFYYLVKKDFQKLKIQFLYIASLTVFYFLAFPKTTEMTKKNFYFDNLSRPDYTYSLIYGILIYLAFFTLPLILSFILNSFSKFKYNYKKLILISVVVMGTFLTSNHFFKPENLASQEFPYFENVMERTGFLPRTLSGTKYQFKYNFIYYKYSDLISKISVAFVLVLLIFKFKNIINVYSISIFGFIFLMLFAYPFFDRYLLYIFPISALFLAGFYKDLFYSKLLLAAFIIFQSFFSYFFIRDFVETNKYIWSKSVELSRISGPSELYSTVAWTSTFGRNKINPVFIFTYDSPVKNAELLQNYKLVETYKVDFIGNLFIKPEIYLFQSKN